MSLLAYFVERASPCAVFAKNACPRWPILLRRASLHAFCAKKLCVLVDLPYWKVRHDVHFSKKVCMSLLVYPVEKGVTTCILLCKQNSCPLWPTLLKGASLCVFRVCLCVCACLCVCVCVVLLVFSCGILILMKWVVHLDKRRETSTVY